MIGLALLLACGDPPPTIADKLGSDDVQVRKDTLYALGAEERRQHLGTLLKMGAEDPESSVRQLAVAVAGAAGDPTAVPVFKTMLQNWDDTGGQLAAADALANLAHPKACIAMVDVLQSWPPPRSDLAGRRLKAAILNAGEVCEPVLMQRQGADPRTIDPLLEALRDR